MTTQAIDLIPAASYDTRARGSSAFVLDDWEDSGISADIPVMCGVGPPTFIGRNRSLALTLDIASVDAVGTLDVVTETAASQQARTWRRLGSFPQQTTAGQVALSLAGADAFVRARWRLSSGAAFSFSVGGDASLVLLASAVQVASGVGAVVDLAQYRSSRLTLDVTAIAGGTLSVIVETSGSATAPPASWLTVATFPVVVALTSADLAAVDLARYVRCRWTLSGGATATFGVSGISVLTLATPSDRARLGIGSAAFPDMTPEDADGWLVAATADVIGAISGRYEFPPRAWEDDIRRACIACADWLAIAGRGTEPGTTIDAKTSTYFERYAYYFGNPAAITTNGTLGWLGKVAKRETHPLNIIDSSAPSADTGKTQRLAASSAPLRGWGGARARSRE